MTQRRVTSLDPLETLTRTPSVSAVPPLRSAPPRPNRAELFKTAALGLLVLLALAILLVYAVGVPGLASGASDHITVAAEPSGVELAADTPNTLIVPAEVLTSLGIRKANQDLIATAKAPTTSRPLVLPGTTAFDPARLIRIRARFAPAKVEQVGTVHDLGPSGMATSEVRELRTGDRVKKDETVLGVFYSVDVAARKNDLVDALVQLRLDQQLLDKIEELYKSGATTEVMLLNARRNVEVDRNGIARAQNALRIWNIPEADIAEVHKEAEEISKRHGKRDPGKAKDWGRVELRAPVDGVIVERNVGKDEVVVDGTTNLFQIAQVDRLMVVAHAPEDDLPTLLNLPQHRRAWTLRTVGAANGEGMPGRIDDIGYIIDVNQHSAVVKGHIDNPGGRLRAGQYVIATIDLPPPEDVVEVPVAAVVDDGRQCLVFIQADPEKPHFTLRRVDVTQRFDKTVFVRSKLPAGQAPLTPEEKAQRLLLRQPLEVGERVLAAGVLELKKELEDRQSNQPAVK